MNKKKAFKIVYEELNKLNLYNGSYDAKHGTSQYMYGIYAVMSDIAYRISEQEGEAFSDYFFKNMVISQKKVLEE